LKLRASHSLRVIRYGNYANGSVLPLLYQQVSLQ